jgi:type III secretion system FlhB-like substrate exporter
MAVFGRAGQVSITSDNNAIQVKGIYEFLRDASKADKRFDAEARIAAGKVAENLLNKAKTEAGSITRNRQATEVMKGMKVGKDRVPMIYLASTSAFVSTTNPNRNRKRKVTRGDVFFGAEFGGGKFGKGMKTSAGARSVNKKGESRDGYRKGGGHTSQFLRHRGRAGYFFWPTVRKQKDNIAKEYLDAIQKVINTLKDSA